MMTENNNPVVMTWFQQQQTPAGWFDLLIIMVEGMLNNAGELESQPFLRQMGASLAETHPLPASETVGELEANINRLLTHFHWGVVTIDVGEDGLRLRHQAFSDTAALCGRLATYCCQLTLSSLNILPSRARTTSSDTAR